HRDALTVGAGYVEVEPGVRIDEGDIRDRARDLDFPGHIESAEAVMGEGGGRAASQDGRGCGSHGLALFFVSPILRRSRRPCIATGRAPRVAAASYTELSAH